MTPDAKIIKIFHIKLACSAILITPIHGKRPFSPPPLEYLHPLIKSQRCLPLSKLAFEFSLLEKSFKPRHVLTLPVPHLQIVNTMP
jgi:hypothetical protein